MKRQYADRIVLYGFLGAYVGLMGSVIVWVVPPAEAVRYVVVCHFLLPIGAVGALLIIAGNILHPSRSSRLPPTENGAASLSTSRRTSPRLQTRNGSSPAQEEGDGIP